MSRVAASLILGCWCLVVSAQAESCHAADFSVESKVYNGKDLISSTTTLFIDGKAYDFLSSPDETIILAPYDGRVVLLDNARRVRAEVTTDELTTFCEELRQKAEKAPSEAVRFLAQPEFREELDPESGEIVLASTWMEYRAKPTPPPDAATLKHYEQYLVWQARINTLMNPGAPPPAARLKLNEALGRRQVMAQQVSMKRTSMVPGFGQSLRSEHQFTWRLGEPDRRRIDDANTRLAQYRAVPIGEYLQPLVEAAGR